MSVSNLGWCKGKSRSFFRWHYYVKVIILMSVALFGTNSWASYDPPVGIPAPPFGINEKTYDPTIHCPRWPSAENSTRSGDSCDCYFIDNDDPRATDDNNPFGYPEKPRKTIPIGEFKAGAYVEVRGGTSTPYKASWNRFVIRGEGTPSKYIVISGANAASKPKLSTWIHIGCGGRASYIIFEGFEIQTEQYGLEVRPTVDGASVDHIAVRNCIMHGSGKFKSRQSFVATSDPSQTPNSKVSYVVFYNNISYDAGDWSASDEDDTCSFLMGDNTHYVWILDNIAYRSGGDGAAGCHGGNRNSDHYYIGRNVFYQHRENAIDIKEINNVVISENECYDFHPTNTSQGEAIVVHYGKHSIGPNEVWIINNKIHDSEIGIQVNSTQGDAYVVGNLVYNITHSMRSVGNAILIYNMRNVYVINNTLYNYDTGIYLDSISSGDNYVVEGNIIVNRADPERYEICVPSGEERVKLDYNQFYIPLGEAQFAWGTMKKITLNTLKNSFEECVHCMEGDPLFVNPGSDFGLQSDSPCKDRNLEQDVYDIFHAKYSLNINVDRSGVLRPQGNGWDIGAFEYVENGGGGSGSLPQAPSNLRIQ